MHFWSVPYQRLVGFCLKFGLGHSFVGFWPTATGFHFAFARSSILGCVNWRCSSVNPPYLISPFLQKTSHKMGDRKAVIKNADMVEEMQQEAIECATQALEKYNIEKVKHLLAE